MNFFVVNNDLFDDADYAFGEDYGEQIFASGIRCVVCGSALTSKRWLPPMRVCVSKTRLGDAIFGTYPDFLISKRFRQALKDADLRGISDFTPVLLHYRGNSLTDEAYFFPTVTLSNARIDLSASRFIFDSGDSCPACQKGHRTIKGYDGIVFENPNNIELDIFHTKVLGETPIVSERFRDVVRRHEISNISLIPVDEYRRVNTSKN